MADLLTAAEMRATEQAAIESGAVTGLILMERAGRGVVEAVFTQWPELAETPRRAVVLCGPGNNGGDGFVIARLLKALDWSVETYFHGDAARLPPDARTNHDRWAEIGSVQPLMFGPPFGRPRDVDMIVDAVFGTGLTRDMSDDMCALLNSWAPDHDLKEPKAPPYVVAVDMPSGLCADTGDLLGAGLHSDLTVTFHRRKYGHIWGRGPEWCGKIVVKDIGL